MMHSSRSLVQRCAAVLALLLLGLWGLTTSAAATTPTHHHAKRSGHEHIILLQTNPDGTTYVIAMGVIHARGVDNQIDEHNDMFVFPKGTFKVHHVTTRSSDSSDPVTCSETHTERGKYWVHDGTGAYQHISGRGTYHLIVEAVGCDPNAAPELFSLRVDASGPLHL